MKAIVRKPAGKAVQTRQGWKIFVMLQLESGGKEVKLFADPGDPQLTVLRKGQRVTLEEFAKDRYRIAQSQTVPKPAGIFQHPDGAMERQLEEYLEWMAGLYGRCHAAAGKSMKGNRADPAGVAEAGKTLFLVVVKKFRL